ncbi:MAG: 3-isopropylmalate dehydratase [Methanomicrobiales archaeon]|jgi:methanogen homoaconitase small subunit|nr:3-isopropylmalate dehydratase [Methanomicrobiales archaeon]
MHVFNTIQAPAVCLGDDIDTDLIIAGRYLRTKDAQIWADHIFEDLDTTLHARLNGCIIVAGKNFGCGSSREQAAVSIQLAGVQAIVARSFSRIFFRNALNLAIPLFEVPDITCHDGDTITCSLETGKVTVQDESKNTMTYQAQPLSERMLEIISMGGLLPYIEKRMSFKAL